MKKYSIVLSLLLLSTSLYGEEDIFGYWLAPGSIILIENCNNYVCAKVALDLFRFQDTLKNEILCKYLIGNIEHVQEK